MTAPGARPRAISAGRWLLNGSAGLALAFILMPLIFVTWLAFFRQEIPSFPPEGYSLRWFGAILGNSNFTGGFIVSMQVGVAATLLGLIIGVPAALAIARRRFPGRGVINTLLLMPLVVPGIVLGTSLYVAQIETEILTGLRIGLGVGWSTLVAAELIAATRGLGFMVQSAGEFLATDVVLAGIAVIAIIAFLLELGLRALQRRLTPWHGEVQ